MAAGGDAEMTDMILWCLSLGFEKALLWCLSLVLAFYLGLSTTAIRMNMKRREED